MLTSRARDVLATVDTVIIDEIHTMAATKRGAHLALSLERLERLHGPRFPAHRALGDPAAARRGRQLPRRRPPRPHRRRGHPARARPEDRRPGAGHDPPRRVRGGRPGIRTRPRSSGTPSGPRSIPSSSPWSGPTVRRSSSSTTAGSAERLAARVNETRRRGTAPRAPRLGLARAAHRGRGTAQGRPDTRPGLHQLDGARHRHGRRRPGHPGRVAEVRRARPPARRPRGPPGRCRQHGPHLPEVSRRPARVRGHGRADAPGAHRAHRRAPQPTRCARAADCRHVRRRRLDGRGTRDARPPRLHFATLSRDQLEGVLGDARRTLPIGRIRRASSPRIIWDRDNDVVSGRARRRTIAVVNAGTIPDRGLYGVFLGVGGPARRRTRRGDGLREPPRRDLPAGRYHLADRADHA